MGEFAEMSLERDLDNYIDSIDRYYSDDSEEYPFDVVISEDVLPYKDFPDDKNIVLKCNNYRGSGKKLERVCKIIRKTEKAVLFQVNRDIEDDITIDIIFWLPKSVLYMKKNEKEVYYLKHWAKIKNISK